KHRDRMNLMIYLLRVHVSWSRLRRSCRRFRCSSAPTTVACHKIYVLVVSSMRIKSEVEQVKKVANGRAVGWGIVADHRVVRRVWQVIAAAAGDRRQAPV